MVKCPYCGVGWHIKTSERNGEFICGTTIWARGMMKRRSPACAYIAGLHADMEKLLSNTYESLSGMVDEHVRELMGKE